MFYFKLKIYTTMLCMVIFVAIPSFCSANSLDILPVGGSKSKLTIHAGWGNQTKDFVQIAKPRVVKILDHVSEANASWVKQVSPQTIIIGRIYSSVEDEFSRNIDPNVNPENYAEQWWNRHQSAILAAPSIDYWEGLNEPHIWDANKMQWYARFEVRRTEILAAHGRKAIIASFSVGHPELALWPHFYPAIDKAIEHNGILGLHEYGRPMQQDWDDNSDEGWRVGRYRKIYRQYLIPTGRKIPLAITESGVDVSGGQNDGWQSFYSKDQFLGQLDWYNHILMQDDYVLGSTLFALEIPNWQSFGISPIMDELTERVKNGDITYGSGGSSGGGADVTVDDIWIEPENPAPNTSVSVFARVTNRGDQTTEDVVGVGFHINGSQQSGFWHIEQPMIRGESKVFKMDTDYLTPSSGTFKVKAGADDINRFPESNETNNWREETFQVQTLQPDVVVQDIWLSNNNPKPNSTVSVYAKVKNIGGAMTPDNVGVGFWINGGREYNYWHLSGTMAAGSTKTFKMNIDYRVGVSGKVTVLAWADDINRFAESNENNNQRTETFNIATESSAVIPTSRLYTITNHHSGKALSSGGWNRGNGTNVVQWDNNGKSNKLWKLVDTGDGFYKIVNFYTGKLLDVSGVSYANKANIHMWDDVDQQNAQWKIIKNSDSSYRILARHSNKSLDVAGASQNDGANIQQYEYHGGSNQRWYLTPVGPQKITAKHSGKALSNYGYNTNNGNNQVQWPYQGTTNQWWQVEIDNQGRYQLKQFYSNKYLTVQGNNLNNGGNIIQYAQRNTDNQKWYIESEPNGYFKIKSVSSGKVIDVAGISSADLANIHQWSWVGGDNQRWQFQAIRAVSFKNKSDQRALTINQNNVNGGNVYSSTYRDDWNQKWFMHFLIDSLDHFALVNHNLWRVVEVSNSSSSNAANIQGWRYHGGNNQRWKLTPLGDGYYQVKAKHSNKVLDASAASENANVHQWQWHAGSNQRWQLREVGFEDNSQPPQTSVDWDKRLDNVGVVLEPAQVSSGTWYWKLIKAEYLDENQSGGRHNIYFKALDANGAPIERQKVKQFWSGGFATALTKGSGIDDYWANTPMYGTGWCPGWPDGGRGPYGGQIDGLSDKVVGMGMPCNIHVSFKLTWKWTQK